jgi:hypothetical protein
VDRLIAEERNPKALAQLARARARRKITELEQALGGAEFFTPAHAALLKAMLERYARPTDHRQARNRLHRDLPAPWRARGPHSPTTHYENHGPMHRAH